MPEVIRTYLDGTRISVTGFADGTSLPDAVTVDALDVSGMTVEVNAGSVAALNAFLAATNAVLARVVTLRNGLELSVGEPYGGDAPGYPFWSVVGDFRIYGIAGPTVAVETLAQSIGNATVTSDIHGVTILASRSVYPRPSIMQAVDSSYLIDVRPATERRGSQSGLPVAGGHLSRSDPSYPHPYLLLDADSFLAYFLPVPGQDIALAVDGASRLVLTELTQSSRPSHTHDGSNHLRSAIRCQAARTMTLTFETLPVVSRSDLQTRTLGRRFERRSFIKRATVTAGAIGIAYLGIWDIRQARAANDGRYFKEFDDPKDGPCGEEGYADDHNERGIKCGDSHASSIYCWTGSTTVSGEAYANTGNRYGWHKWGWHHGQTYYTQRPDHCWDGSGSDYDSWQWTFSDGVTYGCSDGWQCHLSVGCYLRTICPFPR